MPDFQPRPLGPEDIAVRRRVRIWDAQRAAPFDEGEVIAWTDQPTVVIRHEDGTTKSWVASLPWEPIA